MKISIIDTQTSGLLHATSLASNNDVMYMNTDSSIIRGLNKGILPITVPGLDILVSQAYNNGQIFTNEGINYKNNPDEFASHIDPKGKLYFTDALGEAIAYGDTIYIYVEDDNIIRQLKEDLWRLVLENKTIIFKTTKRPLVEELFSDWTSGKNLKHPISWANPDEDPIAIY